MMDAQPSQRPLNHFIARRHDALMILMVGAVLMIGFVFYLSTTGDGTPKPPSQSCQDYATLSAADHGSTGDAALDKKVQDDIAFAKSECDAGR